VSRARGNAALRSTDSTYVQQTHIITVTVEQHHKHSEQMSCSIFNVPDYPSAVDVVTDLQTTV